MILFLAGAAGAQPLQYSPEAEQAFQRGIELHRSGKYTESIEQFDRVLRIAPPTQRTTAASIMKAKGLMELDRNLEATRVLKELLAAFPRSSYAADAQYMLGLLYARVRRYDVAVEALLDARRLTAGDSTGRLAGHVLEALDLLIDRYRSGDQLRAMLERSSEPRERAYLMLKVAEREFAGGNAVTASAMADSLDRLFPGHPFRARVAAIRSAAVSRSSVKLGLLLPLMRPAEPSAVKQIGNDVYDGIMQAFEEYGADPSRQVVVTPVTVDTERDPQRATAGVRDLADDPAVIGILGPVFSASTEAAARAAAQRGIPIISPTANANGIAAMGPTVFQANADYENRGKGMAQYAVAQRGFTTLAVLAPEETHGRAMGEAFVAECLRLDARVVATEWYARGETDLTAHLQAIRRAAMQAAAEPMISFGGRLRQADLVKLVQLGVPRHTLDSLVERSATVRAASLLGSRARHLIDSLDLPVVATSARTDSLENAATGIDAIYIPISSPEEIGVVTSQLVYFNIPAQILGSGEWNDRKELDANKRYCSGVVFETDYCPDTDDPDYHRFMDVVTGRLGKPPGRYALYGYDTGRMVLDLIGHGAATREALARTLGGLSEYRGMHSRMGFSARRVNPWICIMQYDGEGIRRITELRVEGATR
jgi:branched-chain amino acid transport system substrate-binding protein